MPAPRKRTRPCKLCRERHLKCDGDHNQPCSNCKQSGVECIFAARDFRFKQRSRLNRDLSFSSGQPWLQTPDSPLCFVDETPEIPSTILEAGSSTSRGQQEEDATRLQPPSQVQLSNSPTYRSLSSPAVTQSMFSDPDFRTDGFSLHRSGYHREQSSNALPTIGMRAHSLTAVPPLTGADDRSTPVFVASPEKQTSTPAFGLQKACLIRHFVDRLAHSFDTTDCGAHFTITVPQRAMHSPLLLNAICTASARQLTRLWYRRAPNTTLVFNGVRLPDLNEESAIHYHNVCLSLLIGFSNDPTTGSSEDALAAATILRMYEQVDVSFTGVDSETYQNVVQAVMQSAVITNQHNEHLFTLQSIERPVDLSPEAGLRYAACMIALRQEIWSVLLYRRPFRLPIANDLDYSSLGPANDFVWVNRMILWCADVLRFCFGPETAVDMASSTSASAFKRWDSLKLFEERWSTLQPASFKPLYFSEADPTNGIIFPTIWYTLDAHVIGMHHFEIGRVLLSVYNPRRQRIGIGSRAMDKQIEHQLRASILRMCGMALSKKFHSAMTDAAVGISIGGEYFHDPGEQAAIIDFLDTLEEEHAWPTKTIQDALQEAWKLNRVRPDHRNILGPA